VLQDDPLGLTKHIPPVLQWLGWFAFIAYVVYRFIRKSNRADDKERTEDIEKAVKPYRDRAESAERLSATYEKERNEEKTAHDRCEERITRLKERLEEETEGKDKLQFRLMEVVGRQDTVERRLAELEREMRSGETDRK
jgi:septal ring factor EnvC (AmiA/AmiB activator)